MPDEGLDRSIRPAAGRGGGRPGDVPESVRRRYLAEGERVVRYYIDSSTRVSSFEDHGGRLTARRNDPAALRDMARIAAHRGWDQVEVRGPEAFRRAAWRALSQEGLEVRGYRPTDRERQALARGQPDPQAGRSHTKRRRAEGAATRRAIAEGRFEMIQALVQARIGDADRREAVLERARDRLTAWVERGRALDPSSARTRQDRPPRERTR